MAWVLVDVEITDDVVTCYVDCEYLCTLDDADVVDDTDWRVDCYGNPHIVDDDGSYVGYYDTEYAYYVWIDD